MTRTTATPPRFRWAIVLGVWLLAALTAGLVTWILPESFVSTARIRVEREANDPLGMGDPREAPGTDYDPYFIQTEFEVMQSELVLSNVVTSLDLNVVWGKKYAGGEKLRMTESLALLRGRMDLRPVRNTSLIEIRVYSENPGEAADLANAIATAYRDYRQRERENRLRMSLLVLEDAVETYRKKASEAEATIEELTQSTGGDKERRLREARDALEEAQRLRQEFSRKLAMETVNRHLPATGMVQIVDNAKAEPRAVRPNKPLNLVEGNLVGGLAGFFLATLIFVVERLAYRRAAGVPRTPLPARFRGILHITIALVCGGVMGYACATPLDVSSVVTIPLVLLLGGGACAYIELVNVERAGKGRNDERS